MEKTQQVCHLNCCYFDIPDRVPETAQLDAELGKWTSDDSRGKIRADSDNDSFSIKWVLVSYPRLLLLRYIFRCVGVFDTVDSVGLPEEFTHEPPPSKSLFGFPDKRLGEHIHRAYHALAIDEVRADFVRHWILVLNFFWPIVLGLL